VEPAASDRVLLPLPGAAIVAGAKLAETPVGAPLTDIVMVELKPVPLVVVKIIGIDPPGAMLALVAVGVSVKVARTVRLRD